MTDFLCLDCHAIGSLRTNGACERCGSQAVMSGAILPNEADKREATKELAGGNRAYRLALLDYQQQYQAYKDSKREPLRIVSRRG